MTIIFKGRWFSMLDKPSSAIEQLTFAIVAAQIASQELITPTNPPGTVLVLVPKGEEL